MRATEKTVWTNTQLSCTYSIILDKCRISNLVSKEQMTEEEMKKIINSQWWHLCNYHAWVGPHGNCIEIPTFNIRGPSFYNNNIMSFYDSQNNIASMGIFLHLNKYICRGLHFHAALTTLPLWNWRPRVGKKLDPLLMIYENLSLSSLVNMTYSWIRSGTMLLQKSRSPLAQNGFNLKAGALQLREPVYLSPLSAFYHTLQQGLMIPYNSLEGTHSSASTKSSGSMKASVMYVIRRSRLVVTTGCLRFLLPLSPWGLRWMTGIERPFFNRKSLSVTDMSSGYLNVRTT